jgi:hypothetical protein
MLQTGIEIPFEKYKNFGVNLKANILTKMCRTFTDKLKNCLNSRGSSTFRLGYSEEADT